MKYIDNYSGEIVSEEKVYELATEFMQWGDIAEYVDNYGLVISMLQELQRLGSPLFESIWENALEDYIDDNFKEFEEEEDDE